jgi:hypothetical protein
MAKGYIVKLRRGTKETDANGNVTRDDWAEYTEKDPIEAIPQAGELVLEYDNGIPRLKIGDGEHKFADLPYMSVDSFILPTQASITIYANKWLMMDDEDNFVDSDGNLIDELGCIIKAGYYSVDGNGDIVDVNGDVVQIRYAQRVDVDNATITPNSKIDLQPDSIMLEIFHQKDLAFVVENDGGVITVFCVGQVPVNDYTIQATIKEIIST